MGLGARDQPCGPQIGRSFRAAAGGDKPPRPKRERPLPPPLNGDEAQKDKWAWELEISRADLRSEGASEPRLVATNLLGPSESARCLHRSTEMRLRRTNGLGS